MDSLYNTYLKMLTMPFDDPSSDLPDISPEDYPALFCTCRPSLYASVCTSLFPKYRSLSADTSEE